MKVKKEISLMPIFNSFYAHNVLQPRISSKESMRLPFFVTKMITITWIKTYLEYQKKNMDFQNNILPAISPATFDESAFELNQQEMAVKIILK